MSGNSVTEKQNSKEKGKNTEKAVQNSSYGKRGMYSSITIENFRLFDHLELDDLARVNLFFGPNNCGKTSILEAVYAHACGPNFALFRRNILLRRREDLVVGLLDLGEHLIGLFRDRSSLPYTFSISAKFVDDPSVYTITSEFHPSSVLADLDPRALGQFSETMSSSSSSSPSKASSISSEDSVPVSSSSSGSSSSTRSLGIWQTQISGKRYEFKLNYPGVDIQLAPLFKPVNLHDVLYHRHPSSEIRIFSYLKRYKILREFTDEMAKAFPGVREIDMVPYPDGTQGPVYVEMDDRRLPIFVFGDGMRRWFYLLGHMLVSKNGVHCIEEIDFAFHPAAQRDLSRLLIRYAEQYENQLFLTSHSIEFADIFLDALYGGDGVLTASSEDPVRVFTIKPSEDQKSLDIWKLTGREAYKNRTYYELELR